MAGIKVGIVGSGMMGQQHAAALRRIPSVEIVGIADPCAANLQEKAALLGIDGVFADYREMMAELPLDVLHNCTPNSEHFEINRFAVENGVAIYSEKPLAVCARQAGVLVALAKDKNIPNAVNFNYRNNAMVREMQARIKNGVAGRPLLVHGTYLQDWLMYESDYNWRINAEQGGASRAVADIGSHWFDTVQLILGRPIEAVYAKLFTVHKTRQKPSVDVESFGGHVGGQTTSVEVDTEDAGYIMVRFQGDLYGNLVLSQVSGGYNNALSVSVDCSRCSLRWEQETSDRMIAGDREHGETKVVAAAGKLTGAANDFTTLPGGHPVGWADALYNSIRLFYAAVAGKTAGKRRQEYATFADAARVMGIVDACLQSNASDRWVDVILNTD